MSDFYTQGPVPLDSAAYVARAFEAEMLQRLRRRESVLLLGPRQHGKSTALARVKASLQDDGFAVATLNLERIPHEPDYRRFLTLVGGHLAYEFGSEQVEQPTGPGATDFASWLEVLLPSDAGLAVLIIDEAASIRDDIVRNTFYGQIRSITTSRGDAQSGSLPKRVSFVFAGLFRPESLVYRENSPFNGAAWLETDDLELGQVHDLVRRVLYPDDVVPPSISDHLNDVFAIVGGQPYLLQAIFTETLGVPPDSRGEALRRVLHRLRYIDGHASSLLRRVLDDPPARAIAVELASKGALPLLPADDDYRFVRVVGLARQNEEQLVFRNEFYAGVARQSHMLRPQEAPTAVLGAESGPGAPAVVLEDSAFAFMNDARYRQFAISAHGAAVLTYNAGYYRSAMVGYGSSTEAILIDWLSTVDAPVLAASVKKAGLKFSNKWEDPADPSTWRFVDLMKVGNNLAISIGKLEVPDKLREFRNWVHPQIAIESPHEEEALAPEATTAMGLFAGVLRDVRIAVESAQKPRSAS